ncbi:hypothetical protein EVAR_71009_1 [Eumeta japonica]|uniref:Uncharacterized protein n=1 Tax=Eumeta variegata TaxID=151549 RepID=A0A4C1SDK3_EUMVA|nr:hypothetical protein EVAR_71009_1 [Eumeta japonica]
MFFASAALRWLINDIKKKRHKKETASSCHRGPALGPFPCEVNNVKMEQWKLIVARLGGDRVSDRFGK